MTQDNNPQMQQVDVVAMQQTIIGLQNQRNAAFNDAADLFGKLQSANNTIQKLLDVLNGKTQAPPVSQDTVNTDVATQDAVSHQPDEPSENVAQQAV